MPRTKRDLDADIQREDSVIEEALRIMARRMKHADTSLSSPNLVKQYLICKFGSSEREIFSVLWMDARNRLIEH